MFHIRKLLFALAVPSQLLALNIVITDPNFGLPNDPVVGDPLRFAIQSLAFNGPDSGTGPFTLTVQTNYGVTFAPGVTNVIPDFLEQGFADLFMGDLLIQQDGNFFGVVLSAHDGYQAGNIYQAAGFQNSVFFNRGVPVSLLPGGVQIGSGTVSASPNLACDGVRCAELMVSETFTLNPGVAFINVNDPFLIMLSSATCANGTLLLAVSPNSGEVPEPSTVWLLGCGAVGLFAYRFRTGRNSAGKRHTPAL